MTVARGAGQSLPLGASPMVRETGLVVNAAGGWYAKRRQLR